MQGEVQMPEKDEEWNQDEVMKKDTEAAAEEIEITEVDESEVGVVSEADTVTDDEALLDEAETIEEEASIADADAVDELESDEEAVSESETDEEIVAETPLFEAPKAKKKTNWSKILTGCAIVLSLSGFILFSQHQKTEKAELTAFNQSTWDEAYLDTYEPVAYTFMDKAFLDEAANKDMKVWFDENEAKEGAYLYNIKGDEEYTYLLLSVGQQENKVIPQASAYTEQRNVARNCANRLFETDTEPRIRKSLEPRRAPGDGLYQPKQPDEGIYRHRLLLQ